MEKEFYMKNFLKTFGIIAFVAVLGLGLFTSCEEEEITLFDATAANPQTVIKVTGIDAAYNDKWAILGIDTNPMGLAIGTKITGGTVELKVLNSDNAKAAYAEGYFTVVLMIYNSETDANNPKSEKNPNGGVSLAEKGAVSVLVSKGTVTVPFSDFSLDLKKD